MLVRMQLMRTAEGEETARLGVVTQASPWCIVGRARLQDAQPVGALGRDEAQCLVVGVLCPSCVTPPGSH